MTLDNGNHEERTLPQFFVEWREEMIQAGNENDITPTDYLNQPGAAEFVIAAQWLFCPEFLEYRGCVMLARRFDLDIVDEWFERLDGDATRVEMIANLVALYDLFTASETEGQAPASEDILQLARTLQLCWRGLLHEQFSDRRFDVVVIDDETSNGPEVTFCTRRPGEENRWTGNR
ncbi:MAG: hypothetical protein ACRDT0_01070 [Pseudonocardiaceae bacterium]